MAEFVVTCWGMLDPDVIAKLDAEGIYWFAGAALPGSRRRHHLKIEAESAESAIFTARVWLRVSGGQARDFAILHD